jgi:hypothetical protein
MENTKEKKAFYIGAIFWEGLKDKAMALKKIQEKLNREIDLSRYGTGLQRIVFVPIAVAEDDAIHKEEIKYSGRKKEISLYLKMEFSSVEEADEETFLQQFAQLYLEAVKLFKKHRVRDFDRKAFRRDVSKVFEGNGWLEEVEQL